MGSTGTLLGNAVLGIRGDAPATPAQYFAFVDRSADSRSDAAAGAVRPPELPRLDENGTNAGMEAERERERRRAAVRRHQGRETFTSGLGASGLAYTSTKTLSGE